MVVESPPAPPSFESVYTDQFDFVWCGLRGLGVPPSSIDDAVQDVFVVVHRRLGEFEGRSSIRTWLYAIAMGVARNYRRRDRRKGGLHPLSDQASDDGLSPAESAENREALRLVESALARLDAERRRVFVMAELEQMTAPEIAAVLAINVNTVYSRLRLARADFERSLAEELQGGTHHD